MENVKLKKFKTKAVDGRTTSANLFSKWVFAAVVSSLKETKIFSLGHDDFEDDESNGSEGIEIWQQFKRASMKKDRLKKLVRQSVPAVIRKRLWQETSGGCSFMSTSPELYHELSEKLFGKGIDVPTEVPKCPLVQDSHFMSYYLNPDGVMILRKMLYILSYVHPDVTYSPLLEAVAAIFLHFMEEVWCFACLSSMLNSNVAYFDQTLAETSISSGGFQDCVRMNMKPVFKRLKSFILEKESDAAKQLIFPDWQRMIFEHVEFTVLVRILDCFLVEGPKVLYRSGMLLLQIFYEYSLAYEKIGCPTPHDLCLAIGQHSQILSLDPNDFIKASLRIKLKRKSINKALEVNATFVFQDDEEEKGRDLKTSLVLATDVRELSDIMTHEQWRKLISWLPIRIQLLQPFLLFSTDTDGYSLKTLYTKAEEMEQSLLVLATDTGEVFGAYISESLEKRNDGRKNLTFFGTGETFLFSMKPNTLPFKWVGIDISDGATSQSLKRKLSFVLIEHKPRENPKRKSSIRRAVHRFSRASYKVPHSFSSKDFHDTEQSYGGIRKNQSVLCLRDLPGLFSDEHRFSSADALDDASHQHDAEVTSATFRLGYDDAAHYLFTMEEKEIVIDDTDAGRESVPNDLFVACDDHCFIVGGGSAYGLWLDQNLDHGRSETCDTFRNHQLTASETGDFRCVRLEVYGFKS